MVVEMKTNVTPGQVAEVLDHARQLGLSTVLSTGSERTLLGIVNTTADDRMTASFQSLGGVASVFLVRHPYQFVSSDSSVTSTRVRVNDRTIFGGNEIVICAGPCSVESEEQIRATAAAVAGAGASVLRGGAFKPRTSPYSFQGLGADGLNLLRSAADEHGLALVTEVLSVKDVDLVATYADILQVGARNMHNFSLLSELGVVKKPILLKRGISATIDEWLMAAEYIMAAGNHDIILCERGIRSFDAKTRNVLDLAAIPLLRNLTHLPVIVDPSHGTGVRSAVTPMSLAAIAAGADGLIVEVHPEPKNALSDGEQSLYFDQFVQLV